MADMQSGIVKENNSSLLGYTLSDIERLLKRFNKLEITGETNVQQFEYVCMLLAINEDWWSCIKVHREGYERQMAMELAEIAAGINDDIRHDSP